MRASPDVMTPDMLSSVGYTMDMYTARFITTEALTEDEIDFIADNHPNNDLMPFISQRSVDSNQGSSSQEPGPSILDSGTPLEKRLRSSRRK